MKPLFIIISSLYIVFYLIFAYKSRNIKKTIFATSFFSILLLLLVHFVGNYFDNCVPINIYTVAFSALTGIPGVIFITVMPFIFI